MKSPAERSRARRKGPHLYVPIFCAFIALGSLVSGCVSFPKKRVDIALFGSFREASDERLVILIGEVDVRYPEIKLNPDYPIREIMEAAGDRYRIPLVFERPVPPAAMSTCWLSLDVWITEERFTKELDSKSSVTALFTVKNLSTGETALRLVYSEETAETLDNFHYLYRIIDEGMRRITHEIRHGNPRGL